MSNLVFNISSLKSSHHSRGLKETRNKKVMLHLFTTYSLGFKPFKSVVFDILSSDISHLSMGLKETRNKEVMLHLFTKYSLGF